MSNDSPDMKSHLLTLNIQKGRNLRLKLNRLGLITSNQKKKKNHFFHKNSRSVIFYLYYLRFILEILALLEYFSILEKNLSELLR